MERRENKGWKEIRKEERKEGRRRGVWGGGRRPGLATAPPVVRVRRPGPGEEKLGFGFSFSGCCCYG